MYNSIPRFAYNPLKLLSKWQKRLPGDTKEKVKNGKIRLLDAVVTIKANITGASSDQQLIKTETVKKRSVYDFDGDKLTKSQSLTLRAVKVGYATHATETSPLRAYSSKQAGVDNALLTAVLVISQFGNEILRLPMWVFFAEEIGRELNADDSNVFNLRNNVVIIEDNPVKMFIEFADGQTVAGGAGGVQHFAEISLIGDLTRQS